MALEIRDLTLRFGGLMALNGISLKADDGELVAIVGPNGAGKTALLNCINGVYRPSIGRIILDGEDITDVPVDRIALARVGRAFQHAELFPHMTVTENLLVGRHLLMRTGPFSGAFYFGRARREEAEQRKSIERIIDFFELYRYRDVPAASLPYGVQKLGRRRPRLGARAEIASARRALDGPDAGGKGELRALPIAHPSRAAP
jgi:branched-chain amino acid transport system ATP-binding protein